MEVQPGFRDQLAFFQRHGLEFVANKRAMGRTKDLADLEAIGEA